jgi:hypothetical protein
VTPRFPSSPRYRGAKDLRSLRLQVKIIQNASSFFHGDAHFSHRPSKMALHGTFSQSHGLCDFTYLEILHEA